MVMFGNSARKFDPAPTNYETPPFAPLPSPADPIAALATPPLQPGPMPTLDASVPPQRRGLDSHAIAGIASDFLGGMAGRQPLYAEQQAQSRLHAQNKQDQWETWLAQQQYAAAHPRPVNNDTVNDFNFIAQQIGPDAAKQYLRNISEGPPVAVDVAAPDGSVTRQFLPRTSMGTGNPAQSGPPAQAIAALHANPSLAGQFDAKYGQGASASILGAGGAGPQTPPTFP